MRHAYTFHNIYCFSASTKYNYPKMTMYTCIHDIATWNSKYTVNTVLQTTHPQRTITLYLINTAYTAGIKCKCLRVYIHNTSNVHLILFRLGLREFGYVHFQRKDVSYLSVIIGLRLERSKHRNNLCQVIFPASVLIVHVNLFFMISITRYGCFIFVINIITY